jgi:hypothetical protein
MDDVIPFYEEEENSIGDDGNDDLIIQENSSSDDDLILPVYKPQSDSDNFVTPEPTPVVCLQFNAHILKKNNTLLTCGEYLLVRRKTNRAMIMMF